jgi:hypothetical protein
MFDSRSFSLRRGALLGVGALIVLAVLCTSHARAIKKPIVIFARAFQPLGEINKTGRLVKLQGTGDTTEVWETGERMVLNVTVVQPQTGARAVGSHTSVHGVGHPITPNPIVLVHAVPGPGFQPGPVQASAIGFRMSGARVIRTWNWTSKVVLVRR